MNLVSQFPDVSMKTHERFKSRKKPLQWTIINPKITYDKNLVETKFYNHEFNMWHIKLAFIILLTIASLYFIISNIPMLFM